MATVAEGDRRRVYPRRPSSTSRRLTFHVRRTFRRRPPQEPARLQDTELRDDDLRGPLHSAPVDRTHHLQRSRRRGRERILHDALVSGMPEGDRLEAGGTSAAAYADAVATYMGFVVSRTVDRSSTISSWDSSASKIRNAFARQALPMNWDFAESNLFSSSTGNFRGQLEGGGIVGVMDRQRTGDAIQASAQERHLSHLLSTDPPYYDNIGYSRSLRLFLRMATTLTQGCASQPASTMLVPKAEELVANPYRHGGREGAHEFFEDGFRSLPTGPRERTPRLSHHRLLRLQTAGHLEGRESIHRLGDSAGGHDSVGLADHRHLGPCAPNSAIACSATAPMPRLLHRPVLRPRPEDAPASTVGVSLQH